MAPLTVGLLYPRSSLYPAIGFDVVEAFRAGLRHFGAEEVRLATDGIGIGGMEKEVQQKAEKMLLAEGADILVCYLDHFAAEQLRPLAAAAGRILISMDPGASVPTDWAAHPLCFHLTLDSAFGSRLTGNMAAREGGEKGLFCSNFYDGGYLNCAAFASGYAKAGGSILHHYVAPFLFEDFKVEVLKEAMENVSPEVVLAQLRWDPLESTCRHASLSIL